MAKNNTENTVVTTNNVAEIRTGKATNGEFTVTYQTNGYGGVIPVIDGTPHPELLMGYVSDSDRDAGLELIAEALKATSGDIPEAMRYMYNAAMTAAKEIKAEEAVDVSGNEVIVSYTDRRAYLNTEEIANLDEMACELPREAVKAILIERARARINEIEAQRMHDDDWYDDEDYDDDDYGWEE